MQSPRVGNPSPCRRSHVHQLPLPEERCSNDSPRVAVNSNVRTRHERAKSKKLAHVRDPGAGPTTASA